MNGNLSDNVAGAWRLAVEFLRDKRESWRTIREIDSLDQTEAARVLADAGMGASDFREAVSRPFAFEDLMSEGMASIGIDPKEFAARDADWYRQLQQTCAMCRVRGHCHRVMSHSEFAEGFHEFCPNSAEFDRILADGAAPPRHS